MHYLRTLSFLLLAAPLAVAQATQATQAGPGQKNRPAAPAAVEHRLPLVGLTTENADALQTALESMAVAVHACPKCGQASPAPGRCKGCDVDLVQRRIPLVRNVKALPDSSSVTFDLTGVQPLPLSALTRMVATKGASIDRDRLAVPAPAVLVFSGGANAADADAVGKAVEAAGLYEHVRSAYDKDAGLIQLLVTSARPAPELAAIVKSVSNVSPKVSLEDVVWGQMQGPRGGPAGKGKGPEKVGKKKAGGKQGKKGGKKKGGDGGR